MKVILRNTEVDSNIEPIKLIFKDDSDRIKTAEQILNMEEGTLGYIQFPDDMSIEDMRSYLSINSDDISYKDKWLRTLADFENFKRRVSKEKEDIKNSTKVSMISSILDLDNDLSIAVKQIKDDDAKVGVNLILSKLNSFLKSQDIEIIPTDVYDPEIHEVVSVLETGEDKIIDIVSKGYMIGGKPFRFPKVVISK